jgi:hypothetical protein|tara:strand:- start:879 stop:1040 length:162 start_codon:yes stop_codon:yes gene_type:complete
MSEEKKANVVDESVIKGNEAEEFIKKIAIKIIISMAILIVGVGIAVHYTSGAV